MFKEAIGLRSKFDVSPYFKQADSSRRRSFYVALKQQTFRYAAALLVSVVCTALAFPLYPQFNVTNIAMLYLMGTVLVALRLGRGPAAFLSFINMLALDYFFIPPLFSLDVDNLTYSFTLVVTLVVAFLIGNLVASIQSHRLHAQANEQRANLLYALSRELSGAPDAATMVTIAATHAREIFRTGASVFLPGDRSVLESAVATRVLETGEPHIADDVYVPIGVGDRKHGLLVLQSPPAPLSAARLQLLEAFAGQLALALERAHSSDAAKEAQIASERASLRNTLLASISHDLRTPLAAIAGAGSLIALSSTALDGDRRVTLGRLIERKAQDMTELVSNILKFSELEHDHDRLETDWHAVADLIEHSLRRNEVALSQQRVDLELPADLPLVLVEATLIVQILNNLLQNAAKYTPPGTRISIMARVDSEQLVITIDDDGPGLPCADTERLFEKFQRGRSEDSIPGAGLGLAICRAAARLHGGEIDARNRPEGGARFEVRLPVPMQMASGVEQPRESDGVPA
jgi:two-component system sensor histidine kinase KdpD